MSVLGVAGLVVGSRSLTTGALGAVGVSLTPTDSVVRLGMRECLMEMVDLTRVPMWAFETPQLGPRIPGPPMYVEEGSTVAIEVTNQLPTLHGFAIPGVIESAPIAPGDTVLLEFTAPTAGTYIYLDPLDAPINRAMGLAGMFVVTSAAGRTPYSTPTTPVQYLFDDLGTTTNFPGEPWRPERSWNWAFSSVDPVLHELVRQDASITPTEFAAAYHPTYFMLNGKSGFFAGHDAASVVHGRVGQPAVIRVANLGIVTHSPHIHGNHVYDLATWNDAGAGLDVHDNVIGRDTWEVPPVSTADVLLPFVRPPDAHPWPPSDPDAFTTDLGGDGHHGMVYPMHCHTELSLLANGANYPQGLITHWVLEGDLDAGWTPPSTGTVPTTSGPTEPPTEPASTAPPVPRPGHTLNIDRPATGQLQPARRLNQPTQMEKPR